MKTHEVRVPKPNRSACGFLVQRRRCALRLVGNVYGCCPVPLCQRECDFSKIANALHARQQADRKGKSDA